MTDEAAQIASVKITYTNHRGQTYDRTIVPGSVWFGISEWHSKPQWFLDALDLDKMATRSFAIKDIQNWTPTVPKE